MQSRCGLKRRMRNELKKSFPVIPLIDSSFLRAESNFSPQDVKELQDHLNALEMFLKEYVVDVNYLEKLKKMDQNK